LPRIPTHAVSSLYLEGPSGAVFRMQSNGPAVILIRRIEYDAMLASLAREAGAEIVAPAAIAQASEDADGVTLRTRDGREFRAPIVIAADGVNSVIARRLGVNPGWPRAKLALDMMEETPIETLRAAEPDTLSVFYGYGGAHGYAYIFPKRAHLNVGIGYLLPFFKERGRRRALRSAAAFVGDLLARGLAAGESRREHFTPFLIPIGGPLKTTARGRVLLAGDAGGFVNGFSAEGIYYAMVSGELAADAVLSAPCRGRRRSRPRAARVRPRVVARDRRRRLTRLGADSRQEALFPSPLRLMERVCARSR
jgi:flavin-dependent dehydrogenase